MKPPMAARDLEKVPMIRSTSSVSPKWAAVPAPPGPSTPMPWASSSITWARCRRAMRTISGSLQISPSMEKMPSVMTSLLAPWGSLASFSSRSAMSLWL